MSIKTVSYHSESCKSATEALQYSKTHNSSHRYLAYRDIPALLHKYQIYSGKALDYGTGTGASAQFVHELSFNVVGVDVSKEMLLQAQSNYPEIPFYQMQDQLTPFPSETYDLVFSSFVLFELGTEEEIISYLQEAKRVLKDDGIFIGVTGSQNLHKTSKVWHSFYTNYAENRNPQSGDLVKLYHHESEMEFTDYYWTEADYQRFFAKSGLRIMETHSPLGHQIEPYPWKDETTCSPFVIFVATK